MGFRETEMNNDATLIEHGRLPKPESELRRLVWNAGVHIRNLWHWRTKWAVSYLSKQLQKNPDFRDSWHSNIAMPIYDATRPKCYCMVLSGVAEGGHYPGCEVQQANTIPRRFECREMSIEQANYIAYRLIRHLFNA